jgi:hypothetical protein
MFKVCLLLCVVGLVAAVAPPTISLELAADLTKHSNTPGIVKGAQRFHKDASPVLSCKTSVGFQDYTQTCQAGKVGGKIHKCRLPTARAYDHFDKQVSVNTRYFLVDTDGSKKGNGEKTAAYFKANYWKQRSSWLIKYDARDATGNCAKQIVYGLMMNDITRPVIHPCKIPATIEGNSGFKLCGGSYVTDNMDVITKREIKYDVKQGTTYKLRDGSLAQAQKVVNDIESCDTKFTIIMKTKDHAGSYGMWGNSNAAKPVTHTIVVKDTLKPEIALKGMGEIKHECASTYTDVGATATDKLDTAWGKKYSKVVLALTKSNTFKKSLTSPVRGDYKFCYDTTDKCENDAKQNCRSIKVVDTTKPKLHLIKWNGWKTVVVEHELIGNGSKNLKTQISASTTKKVIRRADHMVHMSKDGVSFDDPGFKTTDACDDLEGHKTKQEAWWVDTFNDRKVGTYTRKYRATDASGNTNTRTREVVVVDAEAPIISISGKNPLTLEAHPTKTYVDAGATCEDYVSGKISVVDGGDEVHYDCEKPGACTKVYKITYNCEDEAGLKAKEMVRTVVVKDTTKPTVAIKGSAKYTMEAGFKYTDAGATASDTLDGDITRKIYVDGNTVMTRFAFTAHTSCNDIKTQFNRPAMAKDGYYVITNYRRRQISVWCHMGARPLTLLPATSFLKIRPYYSARGSVCGSKGLDMLKYDKLTKKEKHVFGRKFPSLVPVKDHTSRYGYSNSYVCSTNDQHVKYTQTTKLTTNLTQRMRKGKYTINYYVKDRAGNHQVKIARRIVTVTDTLPPVISLHLKGSLIQQSASTHRAVHDKRIQNPAIFSEKAGHPRFPAPTKGYTNPFLKAFDPKMEKINVVNKFPTFKKFMAESSSVNGWMIAAVASAITGLALVSFSSKAQTIEV